MNVSEFDVEFEGHQLSCDWYGPSSPNPLVLLHGAGQGSCERFTPLRRGLAEHAIGTLAFDFIGHGRTGGAVASSSLSRRTRQAQEVIASSQLVPPLFLLGSSMGAYNAIKLTQCIPTTKLVLVVPGVYTSESYDTPFGPSFSDLIRKERSWESSDAWSILAEYKGRLLIIAAENDSVIPQEIPQRLFDSATSAVSRELYSVKDSPHLLMNFLNDNKSVMEIVQSKIVSMLRAV